MNQKMTIILGAICLLVGGLVFWDHEKGETTDQKERKNNRVYDIKAKDVTSITISNQHGEIHLAKDKKWVFQKPIKYPADENGVDDLLRDLEHLSRTRQFTLENPSAKQAEYGLAQPKAVLKVALGQGREIELRIGRETPVGGGVYIQTAKDSKEVHVVRKEIAEKISCHWDTLRDKVFMELPPSVVENFIVSEAGRQMEFKKQGGLWHLCRPINARADKEQIKKFLDETTRIKVQKFLTEDSSDLNAYGLREPRYQVAFNPTAKETGLILQIGSPLKNDPKLVYAKKSSSPNIVAVSVDVLKVFGLPVEKWRDPVLAHFDPIEVTALKIQRQGVEIALSKQDGNWVYDGTDKARANSVHADNFLRQCQRLQAGKFVADTATDLKKYGLDAPSVKVEITRSLKKTTPDQAAQKGVASVIEKEIVTLAFGKSEKGETYGRNESVNSVVSIPTAQVSFMGVEPWSWRDVSVGKVAAADVASFKAAKGKTVLDAKKTGQDWTVNGIQTDSAAVESYLRPLANLSAVKWLGIKPLLPAKQPDYSLALHAGGKETVLRVWSKSKEGVTAAFWEGVSPWYFEIASGDADALNPAAFSAKKENQGK